KGVALSCRAWVANPSRISADQVRLDLLDCAGDRLRPPLYDRFAQADDAGVRMHLQEQPAWLDEKRLQLGYLERVFPSDGRVFFLLGVTLRAGQGGAQSGEGPGKHGSATDGDRTRMMHGKIPLRRVLMCCRGPARPKVLSGA